VLGGLTGLYRVWSAGVCFFTFT